MKAEKLLPVTIENAWINVKSAHQAFHISIFHQLKKKLYLKLDSLSMSESRKSYFLHQLAYVHNSQQLQELLSVINRLQMSDGPRAELLYPVLATGKVEWQIMYPTGSLH